MQTALDFTTGLEEIKVRAQVFLFILIQLGFDRGRPENGQEIFFRKDGLQYLGQSNLFVKLQCLLACQY